MSWEWYHDDAKTSAFNVNIRLLILYKNYNQAAFYIRKAGIGKEIWNSKATIKGAMCHMW